MEDIIPGLEEEPKLEEAASSLKSDTSEPGPETPNGVKTDAEDSNPSKEKHEGKEKSSGSRRGGRYHPYKDKHGGEKKGGQRNRVFISNIPYDMKWQAIKDLMRDKVGEVTYVELFKDAEGKSRGCGVVDFKDEEFVSKAIETMDKYDLNGRPLNIKEDPDGEHARRVLQRMGGHQGGRGQDMGPGGMTIPPSISNNPNIPPEIKHALQTGRLGSTVFVANLDFKVGWKKLKEVFSMAGVVKRADVKEDKDGKSRGMGTVTFEQPLEALQAISMFNGQMLFDRQMHVKMDDKSLPPDDYRQMEKPQLPRGLSGIGMGLGPGGQPINATNMNSGGGMGSMGPGGMDAPGFGGMNRLGGGMGAGGGFGSMDNMANLVNFGGRDMMAMGRMNDVFRSRMGGMDRDFGNNDMQMNRGFGDSFGGMGGSFGGGMGVGGMGSMGTGLGGGGGGGIGSMAMDRMGSGFDRMGMSGMDMNRSIGGGGPSHMGMSDRGFGPKAGCQIFVRNLSYELTWQKLKEKFMHCGKVMFAEIKMENGKSKGCGTVRFDCPESAEKACRMMNGTKINGREVDVRIDRNA
ncbi:myelin expression factor 2 [Festucalex cinctus]